MMDDEQDGVHVPPGGSVAALEDVDGDENDLGDHVVTTGPGGIVSLEFREKMDFRSMSLNRSGSLSLLAGRNHLAVVDLERFPGRILRTFRRNSKYEVAESQFSFGKDALCALASNDKVELVDWDQGYRMAVVANFRAHTRKVTDISWHEQETNLLATSSLDNFVNIWDTRDLRRPAIVLQSIVGANQVCWERIAGDTLASAHEGEIRLWDIRVSRSPKEYINAHRNKILALDFSSNRKGYLVSSSHDMKIKFWNTVKTDNGSLKMERELTVTQAPVWRMRFTPFGDGLLTLVMNTLLRGENSLMLWNAHDLAYPVHTFYGHSNMVLEFCWRRASGSSANEHELVSWSQDMSMRVWPIGSNIRAMCEKNLDPNFLLKGEEEITQVESAAVTPEERRLAASPTLSLSELTEENVDPTSSTQGPMSTSSSSSVAFVSEGNDQPSKADAFDDLDEDVGPVLFPAYSSFASIPVAIKSSSHLSDAFELALSVPPPSSSDQLAVDRTRIHRVSVALPSQRESSSSTLDAMEESTTAELATSLPSTYGGVGGGFGKPQPSNLEQEFRLINLSETLLLETRSSMGRSCIISGKTVKYTIYLQIDFPVGYPYKTPPIFTGLDKSTLPKKMLDEIVHKLDRIAEQVVSKGNRCVDICLRHLEDSLQLLSDRERLSEELDSVDQVLPLNFLGSRIDENVPYPRTSGARFCGIGKLVVFVVVESGDGQQPSRNKTSFIDNGKTPKALSTFASQAAASSSSNDVSQYFGQSPSLKNRVLRRTSKARMSSVNSISEEPKPAQIESDCSKVLIYDCAKTQPFSENLARSYALFGSSTSRTCMANASLAEGERRHFVAKTWIRLALSAIRPQQQQQRTVPIEELSIPWAHMPMGRELVRSLLQHHLKCYDMQTVAVAACVLQSHHGATRRNNPATSVDHADVDTGRDVAMDAMDEAVTFRGNRAAVEDLEDDDGASLLSPDMEPLLELAKLTYAGLLHRAGLIIHSVEVRKFLKHDEQASFCTLSVARHCPQCRRLLKESYCFYCRSKTTENVCVICKIRVRGILSECIACGHGGHLAHLQQWFKRRTCCAYAGCLCLCPNVLDSAEQEEAARM